MVFRASDTTINIDVLSVDDCTREKTSLADHWRALDPLLFSSRSLFRLFRNHLMNLKLVDTLFDSRYHGVLFATKDEEI